MKTTEWNWLEFLERAVKREPSEKEKLQAEALAAEWPTCAVGELCKELPRRDGWLEPLDDLLFTMGADFGYFVAKRDWAQALLIFRGIEKRTAELLGEMEVSR